MNCEKNRSALLIHCSVESQVPVDSEGQQPVSAARKAGLTPKRIALIVLVVLSAIILGYIFFVIGLRISMTG